MSNAGDHKFADHGNVGAVMPATKDIDSIIEDIYAGISDASAWNRAIAAIVDLVGGASASLSGVNPKAGTIFRAEIHNLDPDVWNSYQYQWFDRDIRLIPALDMAAGEALFEARLLPLRDWKNSEIYNDFLRREDRPWFLCFWLHKSADKLSTIAIHSTQTRGPLEEHEGALVLPLIPHLRRALSIRDRVETLQRHTDLLAGAVDRLAFGIILLDDRGRILECSAKASALMTSTSGMQHSTDGTLKLAGHAGTQLERWLLGGMPPRDNDDGLLKTFGPDGDDLSILAVPMQQSTPSWTGADVRWMLMIFDSAQRRAIRTTLITRDLGISPREAQLAALLAQGLELHQIATRLHISVHTARTHLKAIFAKTGCRSQSELIRRVLCGPAGAVHRM